MGIVVGTITGLIFKLISFSDIVSVSDGVPTGFLTSGISSMMATVTLVMSVYGIMGVLNAAGALDKITNAIVNSKLGNTVRGTEIAMMLGISFHHTGFRRGSPALRWPPSARSRTSWASASDCISYRRSNLLDGFANSLPVVVPFLSCFVFIGGLLTQGYDFVEPLSLVQIAGGMFYCMVLFVVLLVSVLTGWGRDFEGPDGVRLKKPEEKPAQEEPVQ